MTTEKEILARIEPLEKRVSRLKEELRSAEWDLNFERRRLGDHRMSKIRERRELEQKPGAILCGHCRGEGEAAGAECEVCGGSGEIDNPEMEKEDP